MKKESGMRFIAQKFVQASQRDRVFVVGGEAKAAITRPTRWRRRFSQIERKRQAVNPIPQDKAELAVRAARALNINIAGVDILEEDKTGKLYVIEVNSAPRWVSIRRTSRSTT